MNDNEVPSNKKMQEKAKRELDAIIQSWKDNSEGIPVSRTQENDHSLTELQSSFPSGREEIEGSNCSSLKYFNESETTQSTSSLNGDQRVGPKLSKAIEVQSIDKLKLATEPLHQVGDVYNSAENSSTMCLEDDRNFLVKTKSKEFKVKEISVSAVSEGAVCSSMENSVPVAMSDRTVSLSVDHGGNDIGPRDSPENNQKKHLCNICGKRYKSTYYLSRHTKTAHENQQDHLCNICNKNFTRSESLIRHLRMHEQRDGTDKVPKQGPFKCPKCNKSYQQAYNVTRHMLSHNGVKPFKCTECNKSFTQYTGLSRHLVLHKGSRDFQCKECGKSFARLFVLNRHMLTHSNDKPYKCFVCSKSFIRASQLSNHMNSHQKKGVNSSS